MTVHQESETSHLQDVGTQTEQMEDQELHLLGYCGHIQEPNVLQAGTCDLLPREALAITMAAAVTPICGDAGPVLRPAELPAAPDARPARDLPRGVAHGVVCARPPCGPASGGGGVDLAWPACWKLTTDLKKFSRPCLLS